MPATMFTTVLTIGRYGKFRSNFVTVPWVTALLEQEPGERQRYFVLSDEDEPAPEKPAPRRWGAQPRRGWREVIPLDE